MKYLITGGAGFIGSHLVTRLSKEDVTVIDVKRCELVPAHVKYISGDICKNYLIPQEKYDYVYHLAANADVRGGRENTLIDIQNNLIGTYSILEYMRKTDNNKMIFSSSATIYGETRKFVKENDEDFKPISLYGASKLAAEKYILAYCNNYGLKSWIFRFNNVTGPGNTHGVIKDFVYKLMRDPKKLEILGNGEQIKQYLHVHDCIDALTTIPLNNEPGIYNLAHIEFIKVDDLARIVIDEMELDSVKFKYTGTDRGWIGDVPITILDSSKAQSTGWFPKIGLEVTIRETVRYIMREYGRN